MVQIKFWNLQLRPSIRTSRENPNSDQLELKTALVARELAQVDIDIATFSETGCAKEGKLTEHSGATVFWKGKVKKGRHINSDVFATEAKIIT